MLTNEKKECILNTRIEIEKDENLRAVKVLGTFQDVTENKMIEEKILDAIDDSYKRLLAPSLETEAMKNAVEIADDKAIEVFSSNLSELLLAPPLGQKSIIAIDPGFRTGCKTVVLDKQGKLLDTFTIFPFDKNKE